MESMERGEASVDRGRRTVRWARGRVRRDHGTVGGRAQPRGRRPRGPRLVRDRQPAARARAQGGRAGPDARLAGPACRPGRRHRRTTRTRSCRRWRGCGRPAPGCASSSSRPRPTRWCAATRAAGAATRCPAARAPSTWWPAIERERLLLDPVRAESDVVVDTSDLNVHELRRRMHDAVRRRRVRAPRCRPRCCRSATRTACRSTPTSCSTAASCPTPTGSTSCGRSPDSTPRSATTCSARTAARQFLDNLQPLLEQLLPGVRGRGQGLPDHRPRLHRRPPPLGGHRRGGRHAGCGATATASASSTGTSTSDAGRPRPPGRGGRRRARPGGQLRAVRRYAGRTTAVVATADDGGSTGRLRERARHARPRRPAPVRRGDGRGRGHRRWRPRSSTASTAPTSRATPSATSCWPGCTPRRATSWRPSTS